MQSLLCIAYLRAQSFIRTVVIASRRFTKEVEALLFSKFRGAATCLGTVAHMFLQFPINSPAYRLLQSVEVRLEVSRGSADRPFSRFYRNALSAKHGNYKI